MCTVAGYRWLTLVPPALPLMGFVPYAGSVPDGGRHGYEAAMSVACPHRLAA